jgi:transcription initiation factor TFIIH subunit 4
MSVSSSTQALEYLQGLPLQTHRKLYEAPATVLAVFRCMLPHLGEPTLLRLRFLASNTR